MLGGSQHLQLPAWGSKCGSCLMDYVPAVHRLLEEKVEAIVQSYISRKECVAAFLSVFGSSVLEYDTEGFKIMAFLFEFQHFYFIVKCTQVLRKIKRCFYLSSYARLAGPFLFIKLVGMKLKPC